MNSLQEAYYGCAVCPKSFKFTKHLAKHVEESHSRKVLQNKPSNEEIDKKDLRQIGTVERFWNPPLRGCL